MKLNIIGKIALLLMITFSFSFGQSSTTDPIESDNDLGTKARVTKAISNAGSAYGKGKDLVTSMNADKENYNEEQLVLLEQAEKLQIKLKKTYNKTLDISKDESLYSTSRGSYGKDIIHYNLNTVSNIEYESKETVAIYEEIKKINEQILGISNKTPTAPTPVTGFAPLPGVTTASTNPTTGAIIPVVAVSPEPAPVDGIVESINDNIINDVVNVVPEVVVPEVVVPEVPVPELPIGD